MYGTPTAPALIQARIAALLLALIEKAEPGGGIELAVSLLAIISFSMTICAYVTSGTGAPLGGDE